MGTTSNYSWPYPADTDPVADGAQNIEDLATDADATVRAIELATVMRFANSSARTAALSGIEVEGMLTFLQNTDSLEYYDGSGWEPVGGPTLITKSRQFTSSTTWTVPTGVTFVIAEVKGGGGGANASASNGGTGGSTSFGSIVTALGGRGTCVGFAGGTSVSSNGQTNSGCGGFTAEVNGDKTATAFGHEGSTERDGGSVTPGDVITVTVGAGGSGSGTGGSGHVWIEWQEEL